jgi:hypothetical protein
MEGAVQREPCLPVRGQAAASAPGQRALHRRAAAAPPARPAAPARECTWGAPAASRPFQLAKQALPRPPSRVSGPPAPRPPSAPPSRPRDVEAPSTSQHRRPAKRPARLDGRPRPAAARAPGAAPRALRAGGWQGQVPPERPRLPAAPRRRGGVRQVRRGAARRPPPAAPRSALRPPRRPPRPPPLPCARTRPPLPPHRTTPPRRGAKFAKLAQRAAAEQGLSKYEPFIVPSKNFPWVAGGAVGGAVGEEPAIRGAAEQLCSCS